jgi:hypothetical protein
MKSIKTITTIVTFSLALSGPAFGQGTLGDSGTSGSARGSAVQSAPSAESSKGAVDSSLQWQRLRLQPHRFEGLFSHDPERKPGPRQRDNGWLQLDDREQRKFDNTKQPLELPDRYL